LETNKPNYLNSWPKSDVATYATSLTRLWGPSWS